MEALHKRADPESDSSARVALIGLGAHASHVYLPWLANHPQEAELVAVVDVVDQSDAVGKRLAAHGMSSTRLLSVDPDDVTEGQVHGATRDALNALHEAHPLDAIIISTEPLAHSAYARWALRLGISVLSDKPVVTCVNASVDPKASRSLSDEFNSIYTAYRQAQQMNPRCRFSVSTHRRFHSGFEAAQAKIREVFHDTGWPVTSVNAELADGEWRLPHDLLTQDYHPLNLGYGALSHSGYHVIDTFSWLVAAAENRNALPDELSVFTSAIRPIDVVHQMPASHLRPLFPGADFTLQDQAEADLMAHGQSFGEHDVASIVNLLRNGRIQTQGRLSVTHQSVSSRSWLSTKGRDLYRGNGRVRQESWTVHQGPMQTIRIISAQADKTDPDRTPGWTAVGGKEHFDLHVFRNTRIRPHWQRIESFSVDALVPELRDPQYGHQDVAKSKLIAEFIGSLRSRSTLTGVSDLADHLRSHRIWQAMNESLAIQHHGGTGRIDEPIESSCPP